MTSGSCSGSAERRRGGARAPRTSPGIPRGCARDRSASAPLFAARRNPAPLGRGVDPRAAARSRPAAAPARRPRRTTRSLPSSTISVRPPTGVARTGSPAAIASSTRTGQTSKRAGATSRSCCSIDAPAGVLEPDPGIASEHLLDRVPHRLPEGRVSDVGARPCVSSQSSPARRRQASARSPAPLPRERPPRRGSAAARPDRGLPERGAVRQGQRHADPDRRRQLHLVVAPVEGRAESPPGDTRRSARRSCSRSRSEIASIPILGDLGVLQCGELGRADQPHSHPGVPQRPVGTAAGHQRHQGRRVPVDGPRGSRGPDRRRRSRSPPGPPPNAGAARSRRPSTAVPRPARRHRSRRVAAASPRARPRAARRAQPTARLSPRRARPKSGRSASRRIQHISSARCAPARGRLRRLSDGSPKPSFPEGPTAPRNLRGAELAIVVVSALAIATFLHLAAPRPLDLAELVLGGGRLGLLRRGAGRGIDPRPLHELPRPAAAADRRGIDWVPLEVRPRRDLHPRGAGRRPQRPRGLGRERRPHPQPLPAAGAGRGDGPRPGLRPREHRLGLLRLLVPPLRDASGSCSGGRAATGARPWPRR